MTDKAENIKPLTYKQQRFCEYYIETQGNAAEAARKAGYTARTANKQAPEWVHKHKGIIGEIDRLRRDMGAVGAVTAEEVVKGIRETIAAAQAKGDHASTLRGLELLGKTLALFSDKTVTEQAPPPDIAPEEQALLQEQAAAVARARLKIG